MDNTRPNRTRPARCEENIAAIAESVLEDRGESIRRRWQQLGLTYGAAWRILRRDLKLKTYKIQLVQELKALDFTKPHRFALWALKNFQEDQTFSIQILFSYEANFWLSGYINKQTCRIWDERPKEIQELPEQKEIPEIEARVLGNIWFQQDGATSDTSHQSMDLLTEQFGEQIISRFGPLRSCHIILSDFFLWGYLKSKVFADNPAPIQVLEQNITRVIRQLPVEMLERAIQNYQIIAAAII